MSRDPLLKIIMEFPWWSSGKESTCQCRRHGFHPWSRKIPRAPEQLTPRAAASEDYTLRAGVPRERPPQWEAWHHGRRQLPLLQLEKVHTQQQRPTTPKTKKYITLLKNDICYPSRIHKFTTWPRCWLFLSAALFNSEQAFTQGSISVLFFWKNAQQSVTEPWG